MIKPNVISSLEGDPREPGPGRAADRHLLATEDGRLLVPDFSDLENVRLPAS